MNSQTLNDLAQHLANEEFVNIVSHFNDLDSLADSIVAVYDGWND